MRVEPIRDLDKLHRIEDALAQDTSARGRRRYIMFLLGTRLARRISDMQALKVGDVAGKSRFVITEKKTGKQAELYITGRLKRALDEYTRDRDADEWLLLSPMRDRITGKPKPLSTRQALRDMKAIGRMAGFGSDVNIGTHTMRKTFGYHFYRSTKDIATLMTIYNHSKEETTLIYIGVRSDELKVAFGKAARLFDD